ncbi:SPASM domain-containing protein [Rhodopseudomonas sp. BAL398]
MASKPIANLKASSALEIWNGRAMQRLRQNIKDNRIDPICVGASCRYVMKETMAQQEFADRNKRDTAAAGKRSPSDSQNNAPMNSKSEHVDATEEQHPTAARKRHV